MNLYQATMARIELAPVHTRYERVMVHAKTPQSAGRLLKRVYPKWEIVEWRRVSDKPLVLRLP